MARSRSGQGSARLPWRAAPEDTARTAAGSTAAVFRLAEAATLASAATMRAVRDLTSPLVASGAPVKASAAPAVTDVPPVEHAEPEGEHAEHAEPEGEHAEHAEPEGEHEGEHAEHEGEGEDAQESDPEGPVVAHWDELNLARIRGRLPRLSLDEIRSLLAYEHAHAGRLPVLSMLENRIRKLEGEAERDSAALAD